VQDVLTNLPERTRIIVKLSVHVPPSGGSPEAAKLCEEANGVMVTWIARHLAVRKRPEQRIGAVDLKYDCHKRPLPFECDRRGAPISSCGLLDKTIVRDEERERNADAL
jgi:hypothetical protein